MSRQNRIRIIIGVITIIAVVIVGLEIFRQNETQPEPLADAVTQLPGTIALYQAGNIVTFFTPASLTSLESYGFEEAEEGKLQSGALLRDVILLYVDAASLSDNTQITVSSSERDKSVTLTWAQVANPDNHVLFDPSSNRGTLKLVSSTIETLDTRNEWIQDTDRIDID